MVIYTSHLEWYISYGVTNIMNTVLSFHLSCVRPSSFTKFPKLFHPHLPNNLDPLIRRLFGAIE